MAAYSKSTSSGCTTEEDTLENSMTADEFQVKRGRHVQTIDTLDEADETAEQVCCKHRPYKQLAVAYF